ncbi:hypothetical protein [Streptomyces sp. NPDC007905]|uniref:hypothetical protein n=1 Tax=Streptomyces sp. NPDC007905 TaxID=3364788 RepID=UPI0036E21C93
MGAASSMRLTVSGAADVDREELDELTRQLRRRLLELDVDDVQVGRAEGNVPDGAKPGELLAAGALVVSLAPAVLRAALRVVETWMQNRPVRTVTVDIDGRTIELRHASTEQQERLVNAYLEGVAPRTAPVEDSPAPGAPTGATGERVEPPAVRE